MNNFIEKLEKVERNLSLSHGPIDFFAAVRPDHSLRLWDLLVSAPWLEHGRLAALRHVANALNKEFSSQEIVEFSGIDVIRLDDPGLLEVEAALESGNGRRNFKNVEFFGALMLEAYIIRLRRSRLAQVAN